VLVGSSRVLTAQDSANAFGGSTPSRAWGKDAALLHINDDADPTSDAVAGRPTFGFTAVFQGDAGEDLMSGSIEDPDMGMRGGIRQRVGMSYKKLISAPELGYFFEDAVA